MDLGSVSAGLPYADDTCTAPVSASPEVPFKSWLLTLKTKEWDNVSQSYQMTTLETKSLCGSPGRSRRVPEQRQQWLANQKHQILARFGQHLPGFGFTRSGSSLDASQLCKEDSAQSIASPVRYTYSYGNQTEYMGGPYGYVDPMFGHHFRPVTSAIGHRSVHDSAAQNIVARSAESLLVISANPVPYPIASNQP